MEIETSTNSEELFVVQRCWFSGPQQYQPLDFLRLFLNQRDAEEAAFHSAHAWCKYHDANAEPQVKTLLLPGYPTTNSMGSSYGFIAHGSLFWVRSLQAAVLDDDHQRAFAVVTEGVIGGTGNKNSRRGTETSTGRVFVGAQAPAPALEACHAVMAQLGSNVATNVAVMPIGKPDEYSTGNFLKHWPPQVLKPNLLQASTNNENKRQFPPDQAEQGGIEVVCPFENPAAKRRRFHNSGDSLPQHKAWDMTSKVGEDQVMMGVGSN